MRFADNRVVVRGTADARAFREGSARLVASHPVLHSVLATTLDHAVERPADYPDARWYWATRGSGRWLGVAMHTPPRPLHIVTSDAVLARAFAYRLREQGVQLDAVSGLTKGCLPFAESWVELGGAAAISVARREGLYDLPGPARPPRKVAGSLRPATEGDLPVLDAWALGYAGENAMRLDDDHTMAPWVAKGGMRVWEVDGEPVAMAYASRPHGGVSRISWVYTPTDQRGRRYGSAVVAGTAGEQRQTGLRVLLYTDLDNQPATALYARTGFRRIGDSAVLRLLAEEPVLSIGSTPMRRPRTPAAVAADREQRRRREALAEMIGRARRYGRN